MITSGHPLSLAPADNFPGEGEAVRRQQQTEERRHRHERATAPVKLEERRYASPSPDLGRELDEILDEIDEALEENAEEFVKKYKGGQ